MRIWNYHPISGELMGEGVADKSPLEPGVFLIPSHATVEEPPPPVPAMARAFRDGAWVLVPDHRGETWWRADRTSVVVDRIGSPADDGLLSTHPLPSLAEAQAARVAEAWAAMQLRVATGSVTVTTSAGTHAYGTDLRTQDNLTKVGLGIALGIGQSPRPWTPKGAAAPISVTNDDLKLIAQAVGNAYDAHVQAYLVHKAAIMALGSAAAVQAHDITTGWPA